MLKKPYIYNGKEYNNNYAEVVLLEAKDENDYIKAQIVRTN